MFDKLIPRQQVISNILNQMDNRLVLFITGLRRIGKTSIMKLLIKELIERKNISANKILYISADDYLLMSNSLLEIVDEFRKIHHLKFEEKIYLFFDEITYKADYEIQLKNLVDHHNVKIIASSSSASLLTYKKPYLTGRHHTFEIIPLSFNEYLFFKKINIKQSDSHLKEQYFLDFLKTGGIPEYVLSGDYEYIRVLVDDIIYKDIAAVHNIKNINLLKDYFLLLMERAGKQVSLNKIASILSISPDTSGRFFSFFLNTYLSYMIPRHGKTNEKILAPKKIYAPDLGIRNLFTGFRDIGSLFENYVFLQIKHTKPSYIYKDKTEIDFLTENRTLIEVKFHNEELSKKQQELFTTFNADQKIIIRTPQDIEDIGL